MIFVSIIDSFCWSSQPHSIFSCIHSYDKKHLASINRGLRTLSQSIVIWIFMRFHILHNFERFWIPKEAFWRFYFLDWLHSKYWPFTKVAIKPSSIQLEKPKIISPWICWLNTHTNKRILLPHFLNGEEWLLQHQHTGIREKHYSESVDLTHIQIMPKKGTSSQ